MMPKRLFMEVLFVAVLGVALSALLYSPAFHECCIEDARLIVGMLTLPADLIGMVIGGGLHSATPVHFTIGLILQLLVMWLLLRCFLSWRKKLKAS